MPESGSGAREVSPPRRPAALAVANSAVRQNARASGLLEPYHDIASTFFTVSQDGDLDEVFLTAARDGDYAKIDALLRRRNEAIINIDARDRVTGNTPLIWAAKRGHSKIVLLLLRHGADITLRNHEGQTAVEVASPALQGQILDSGEKGGPHRNLLQAAWQGNARLVKKILADNQVDINCRNSDGLTPLLLVTRDVQLFEKYGNKLARGYNPKEVVDELLSSRADPNAMDEEGRTPLHYVSSSRALRGSDILNMLIKEGCDIEARDRRMFTPIHCASQSGNVDIVVALLDSGSEANARGYAGATPLHVSAINGHDNVVNKLLRRGADVTIVDDSGLTPVDVAKTRKVKATLKQAWAEVTTERSRESLKPVRGPGSTSAQSYQIKPKSTKKRGQVIFDLRSPNTPVLFTPGEPDPRYNMYLYGTRATRHIDLNLPTSSSSSLDALTPRRAAVTMLQRQLTNAEKVRKVEEQKIRDVVSASTSRSRTSSATTPRGISGRRLSPIRNPSPGKQGRREIKFSAGTKDHDGGRPESESSRKNSAASAQRQQPGLVRECSIPVTILGLDLDDNLQEVRVKRIAHGPSGQLVNKKNFYRSHSSDTSVDLSDEFYLRGHASKASTSTTNDDWEEASLMSMGMRTPSATSRLHTIEERSTTSDKSRPLILDLDQMMNQNQSPIQGDASLHHHPNSHHLLPPTPVYTNPDPSHNVRVADMGNYSGSSKETSPRSDDDVEPQTYCGDIKLAVGNVQDLVRPKSVLNQGKFSIEATRVNSSNDSGFPEEQSPSSSNNSPDGTPSAPIPDEPEEKPRNSRNVKKVSQDNNGAKPSSFASPQSKNHASAQSEANANKKDINRSPKDYSANVHHNNNAGAKLRQAAKDNAAAHSSKTVTIKPVPLPGASQKGNQVTVYNNLLQHEIGKDQSKSLPSSPVKTPNTSPTQNQQQQDTPTSVSVPSSPVKQPATSPSPVRSQQAIDNSTAKNQPVNKIKVTLKPANTEGTSKAQSKAPPARPPPPNSAGKASVSQNAQNQGASTKAPGTRPIPPPRNKSRTPSASSISSNESTCKEMPVRPPPPSRAKTTTTETSQTKAGKVSFNSGKKNKPTVTKTVATKQGTPQKKLLTETTSFRLSTYIAQRDAMSGGSQDGNTSSASKSAQSVPTSIGPTIILTSQSQKQFDLSGIPDVNTPQLITDENQNEKAAGPNRQITQIKVKEMSLAENPSSSVDISQAKFVEKPNADQFNGPVIWDPFEAIRDQVKNPNVEGQDKTKSGRARSATKRKAFERQTSSARKASVTKSKEIKVFRKKAGRPRSPRERSKSPRGEKKTKKVKKKGKKGSKDMVEAIVNENGETNVAFIGGLGWQISTECNEQEPPKPLNLNKPALLYDSEDEEDPTPRLTVKPNYLNEETIVAEHLFDQSITDDRYGSQFLQLPGQLEFGDSDTSDDSEFGDDDIDELLPEAEETVTEVVFDSTPRVLDISPREVQKGKLLKPKRVPLRRGGTEDDDMEVIIADDTKNASSQPNSKNTKRDTSEGKEQGGSAKKVGAKPRNKSNDRASAVSSKRSPKSSPRTSPRVTPRSSPMASPIPSPKASPRTTPRSSPRSSARVTPRSSPRSSPYSSPNRAQIKGVTPGATAVTKTQKQNISEKKGKVPQAPPRRSKTNKDGSQPDTWAKPAPVKRQKPVESDGKKHPKNNKNLDDAKSTDSPKCKDTKKDDIVDEVKTVERKKTGENALSRSESNEHEIDAIIDEILKSTPHPSMSLSLKSKSGEDQDRPERTEEELLQISINARNKLQSELSKSQNGRLFCELKSQGVNNEHEEAKDDSPLTVDEQKELEKIMHSLRHMELTVSDKAGNQIDQSLDDKSNETGQATEKKPPLPPGATSKNPESHPSNEKSPRFVRKINSWKDGSPTADINTKEKQDEEDLEALVNLSIAGSDFHSDALSMASGFNDDSMVPKDGRVMTSRIGRRNSIGRVSAMSNHESSADEVVETIQWKRGNMLGKGAYGKVWCGLTNKGELIAVKQIELNINDMEQAEEEYEKIQEEVELLKTLKHPNIVGYLGTSLEDNLVNIFMQFVPGGSIANILARFGALEEDVFCLYTKQILEGVAYLHKNNVIHRDIKGGNIMVMHNGIIKLIDFGCAKRLCLNINSLNNSHSRLLKSMRGTPYWMAPEVVKETGYGTKSDIWSIGCTVYEMATRKPPWADFPPMAAIFAIGSDREVPQMPDKFSKDAKHFVSLCMTKDEKLRPSAADLLSHHFVQKKRR